MDANELYNPPEIVASWVDSTKFPSGYRVFISMENILKLLDLKAKVHSGFSDEITKSFDYSRVAIDKDLFWNFKG